MTGLERNADVVEMATYAPLFAHVEGWQWRPDMIWFDNLRSMPTASYYVQQMYSLNKGSRVVPATLDGRAAAGLEGQDGIFATAAYDNATGEYIVKIANTSDKPQEIRLDFKGLKKNFTTLSAETLHAVAKAENTLDNPDKVQPLKRNRVLEKGEPLVLDVPARTFGVYRLGF